MGKQRTITLSSEDGGSMPSSTIRAETREPQRDAPLREFLSSVHARHLWSQRVDGVGMIEAYLANGRILIVQVFQTAPGGHVYGWDVYIPADTTGEVTATLERARSYIEAQVL